MGEKDITQRQLAEYEDIFADIVNALLLDGRQIIQPHELKPAQRESLYKDRDMKIRMQERDIAKFWERGGIRLAFIGLEEQVSVHRAMPVRIIGYDGAVYRDQLNKYPPEDEVVDGELKAASLMLYPVITIVLHFDYERHWTGPRTLKECFHHIPSELEPYVNDYKIHVFEIAWLPDEVIERFRSDFRFVADYYSQMRKSNEWRPMPGRVKHVKELFDLFHVLTKDRRFLRMYEHRKEEQNDMASIALDYLEAEMETKLTERLTTKLTDQLTTKLTDQLTTKLTDQLTTKLTDQLTTKLTAEYKPKWTGEAMELAMLNSIRNLMKSSNWTAQQAMDALLIPKEDQEKYANRI